MSRSGLGREIGKKNDFERVEEEVLLNLLRTNDQLQFRFLPLFREHGLTPSQYNVLRILRGEGRALPCLDVASRMVTAVPGITGLIDRLEAQGLVVRGRCESDRRVVFVSITEKGQALIGRIDLPLQEMQRSLLDHLSETELRDLIRLLEKVRRIPEP